MRVTSITPMKNEGPYILEWVAYHRSIGLNDMWVFTNHCADGTDLILERLDELGVLRHMPNPAIRVPNARFHIWLLKYVNEMARIKRSDWIINLDADEFIRIKVGDGKVKDLFDALPDAHAISLSLFSFGTSGLDDIVDGDKLLVERFVMKGIEATNRMAVKTFASNGFPWRYIANNVPLMKEEDVGQVNWVNGDGTPIARDVIRKEFKSLESEHRGTNLADIAHYTVRSFKGFLNMRDRGSANPIGGKPPETLNIRQSRRYFNKYNANDEIDTWWTEPRLASLRKEIAALKADNELRELHEQAVAWHQEKAEELAKARHFRRLYRLVKEDHKERYVEPQESAGTVDEDVKS